MFGEGLLLSISSSVSPSPRYLNRLLGQSTSRLA